jgi:hypothetical protein
MKTKILPREKQDPQKTNPPGQNPKADDSPEKDEHHDENRENVARAHPKSPKDPSRSTNDDF